MKNRNDVEKTGFPAVRGKILEVSTKRRFLSFAVLAILGHGHAWGQSAATPGTGATPSDSGNSAQLDAVIVTGSRTETTVGKSATPVTVVGGATLQATGQGNLRDALIQISPSIANASPYGGDNSLLTNSLSLDGLSPDHVLVLINGKRRHGTANMVEDAGPYQGSTGVDLDLIPTDLIDHIEILRDGASAQYGSDAIAGVINIILKDKSSGGALASTDGQTYKGDGFKSNETASLAFGLGGRGFFDLSAEYGRQNHTVRTGPDYLEGLGSPQETPIGPAYYNPMLGEPAATRQLAGYNAGYDLTDNIEFYSFATTAHRYGESYQNYRLPSLIPEVYPDGFVPVLTSHENDYSFTAGLKDSDLLGWSADFSTTYGGDYVKLDMFDSINTTAYDAIGYSPTRFYLGVTSNSQFANTLDFTRPFEIAALAQPLNVAFGFEARRETYTIKAGDPFSYEYGGPQAELGFAPINAGVYDRNVYAGYLDLSSHVTDNWQADLAGRFEHYSDAGDTTDGKFSTRYDFSPEIAVRGSVSTGFHAPSLAEEHFSSLNESPANVSGQLQANSAAALSLGAQPLKPEKATNFNLGAVFNPWQNLNITLDAYQIAVRNRIVMGGFLAGAQAREVLNASGLPVNPSIPDDDVSLSYFTNGADTRTRGADITAVYHADYGNYGKVDWDFAANLNTTRLTRVATDAAGDPVLNAQEIAYLTTVTPKSKVIFGGTWRLDGRGDWALAAHETFWSATEDQLTYFQGPNAFSVSQFAPFRNGALFTTDLEARYQATQNLQFAVGANNLFDRYPARLPFINQLEGVEYDGTSGQQGFNGGFYYARARYLF